MAPMPKIKEACPFCGSHDLFVERADYASAYVFCNSCSAKGPTEYQLRDDEEVPGERSAIKAWNKRRKPAHALNIRSRGNCGGYDG